MKPIALFMTLVALLASAESYAETFEIAGMIESVRLDRNEIFIDGQRYRLPNTVVDSGAPNAGPAIFQLKPGTSVACSGSTEGELLIETLHIHRPLHRLTYQ
nr:PilY2 family type 4a fimbrial biogenesis protein [uncultured Pseudomonas sp.]